MFIGTFQHTIDGRGRVSVPSDMRDTLKVDFGTELLLVTKAPREKCLWAFPPDELTKAIKRLRAKKLGTLSRFLTSNAKRCPVDSHGRILLTEEQREHCGMSKVACFVGNTTHIQIWALEHWDDSDQVVTDDEAAALEAAVMELD